MANRLQLGSLLESLWMVPPAVLAGPVLDDLAEATTSVAGAEIGIPQEVVDGARTRRPVDVVEYAQRVLDNAAAFPETAERMRLAALILLPVAFRRVATVCETLVRVLVLMRDNYPADDSTAFPLEDWRELCERQIARWRAWYQAAPSKEAAQAGQSGEVSLPIVNSRLELEAYLSTLWMTPPGQLTPRELTELSVALYGLRTTGLGIPQVIVDGARAGDPLCALEYAERVRHSDSRIPDPIERLQWAALVLLPHAFLRQASASQRLVAVLEEMLATGPGAGLRGLTAHEWRKLVTYQIVVWKKWTQSGFDRRDEPGKAMNVNVTESSPTTATAAAEAAVRDCPLFAEMQWPVEVTVVLGEIPDSSAICPVDLERYEKLRSPLPVSEPVAGSALAGLDETFPQFAEVTRAVREELELAALAGAKYVKLTPRLLVGPPGTGKNRYLLALGDALGRPIGVLSAAAGDGRTLIGTSRGWSSASPSFPISAIANAGRADPILVIDEIDKAARDGVHANLQAGLLTMMERATSAAWYDECLMAPCDFSWIAWMLTANGVAGVSAPLLDRCRIHRIGRPDPAAFDAYMRIVLADVARDMGVPIHALPTLHPLVYEALRKAFRRNPSLRALKRTVPRLLAASPRAVSH